MKSTTVELVWTAPGPALDAARGVLVRALPAAGLPPYWDEWRAADPLRPPHARPDPRGPCLFVNHRLAWADGQGWDDATALGGRVAALAREPYRARTHDPLARRLRHVMLPALGLALLPKCPLCWGAYTAVAAAFGLAPLLSHRLVLAALALTLAGALAALVLRCRRVTDPRPLVPAVLGVTAVLAGRLVVHATAPVYLGLALLSAAALWAAWPRPARLPAPYASTGSSSP